MVPTVAVPNAAAAIALVEGKEIESHEDGEGPCPTTLAACFPSHDVVIAEGVDGEVARLAVRPLLDTFIEGMDVALHAPVDENVALVQVVLGQIVAHETMQKDGINIWRS